MGRRCGLPALALCAVGLAGCSSPDFAACPRPVAAPVAWIVDQGWHTDVAIPADEITGPLTAIRDVFPSARFLVFGFGKRTFITAKVETPGELLMGPVPGPGAIQVVGLSAPPNQAFDGEVIRIGLPPDGAARLSDFLWSAFGKTRTGVPRLISEGLFPGSLFYASAKGYNLFYTCNTWTADALASAGFPVGDGVIFANDTLQVAGHVPGACRAAPGT